MSQAYPDDDASVLRRTFGEHLSRRILLQRAVVTGIAGATLPAISTSSALAAGSGASASPSRKAAQSIQQGGDLSWGMREPNTLDPHVSSSRYDYQVEKHLFDSLVIRDDTGAVVPHLAEKWESNETGTEWTFTLKQGVKFHDGTPFDASVVKFSFDRMMDPNTKSEQAQFNLGPYDHTEVIDEFTAKLVLKSTFAPLLLGLAEYTMAMVSPAAVEKYGQDFGRNPVGTGPFIFKEWQSKDHITIVKNPDYNWAPSIFTHNGPPYLDSLTTRFITESETLYAALLTGQIDLVLGVPDIHLDEFKSKSDFAVMTTTVQGCPPSLMINQDKAPTDDVKVRQALMQLIDRNSIIEAVYSGSQVPAEGIWNDKSPYFWQGSVGLYPLDSAKAESLLDEAGWTKGSDGVRAKDGTPLELVYLTLPGDIQGVAEYTQAILQESGIKVNILVEDNPAQQQDAQKGVHNIVWLNWLLADPYGLATLFGTENIGTGWNFSHYSNPTVDELFKQGVETVDEAARKEIYDQIQQTILGDAACFPINYFTRNWGMSNKVQDFRVGPDGEWMHLYETWLSE